MAPLECDAPDPTEVSEYLRDQHGITLTWRDIYGDHARTDPGTLWRDLVWRKAREQVGQRAEITRMELVLAERDRWIADVIALAQNVSEQAPQPRSTESEETP